MLEKTILLVEDEPNSVTLFQYAAAKLHIKEPIQVARDGMEAISYIEGTDAFADRHKFPLPRLVVLDLRMPGATGFEVLKQLRSYSGLGNVVVVVFTASNSNADIAKAYELGANAFVVKPSTLNELIDVVRSIRGFWLLLDPSP